MELLPLRERIVLFFQTTLREGTSPLTCSRSPGLARQAHPVRPRRQRRLGMAIRPQMGGGTPG